MEKNIRNSRPSRCSTAAAKSAAASHRLVAPKLGEGGSVVRRDIIPFTIQIPFKGKVSQAQSSLVKVNASKQLLETACSRQFLPIGSHPAQPFCLATAPVKVSQGWSKLVQHKFGKMVLPGQNKHGKEHAKSPKKS